jgi:hypothetical protein
MTDPSAHATDRSSAAAQASADRLYERFQLIVNGPALFNAIVTALDLDIFTFLAENRRATAEDILKFTTIPGHQLRILLHALCATELVEKQHGCYSNSPLANSLLAPSAADSWRHILIGWQRIYYPAFAHMTTSLRTGTNTALAEYPGSEPTLYERLMHNPELEQTFHAAMTAFTLQSMDGLLVSTDFAGVRHLLDVGGGDGATARAISARYAKIEITVLDLPSVTRLAEAGNAPRRVDDRVTVKSGDLFKDEFPPDIDAVLFSHVLEVFASDQILVLLAKAFNALPVGGTIFIYGFNAADDERRGVLSARLSLYLNVLASGTGMAYPATDYERWLRRIGCRSVTSITDLPYEHGLTMGVKE